MRASTNLICVSAVLAVLFYGKCSYSRELGLTFQPVDGVLDYTNHAAMPKKPNVLFIIIDDQGSSSIISIDLLMNSMDFMPTIKDKVGRNGVIFKKHYCISAFCCPSRASLFTGKCVQRKNAMDKIIISTIDIARRCQALYRGLSEIYHPRPQ
ncbi:hypothetical protein N7510_008783 [Penicillium lagena]|uniref:uncharacterized protein n=1 Tax=Penicillium lagena TaxID=94218 RepID=UPI002540B74C|nr:uncharacterized protein N7510_008783 [Penicillium lagena]KAJ5606002.1 hypothetical protein N7510_008783 [Penicillium lagena]